MANYTKHVIEVLYHLWKARIYVKAERYEFYLELVEYLRYILSPSGLTMAYNKIKIIQEWFKPKKSRISSSFLDLLTSIVDLSIDT